MDNGVVSGYNPATMIIRNYILNHLAKLFLGASLVLYGVLFIVEVMRMGQVVSKSDFDVFLLALIPLAVFVLPMALVFSVLMVLERLSVESEIIAMQACGIPKRRLYTPVLILGFVCMVLHMSISMYLGPLSMKKIQERLVQKAPEKVYAFLQEREFIDTFKDITLYIESVNQKAKKLTNVFIETRGKSHSVIAAEKGTLEVLPSGILMRLGSGSVFMETPVALRYITFDEYNFFLEADFKRELKIRRGDTATMQELGRMIHDKPQPKLIKEYHNRIAFPIINIILALVGLQFGIQKPRSPRHTGIIVGVGTILLYYLLFLLADRLVKGGALDPVLGAWMPNIVFMLLLVSAWAWGRLYRWKGGV